MQIVKNSFSLIYIISNSSFASCICRNNISLCLCVKQTECERKIERENKGKKPKKQQNGTLWTEKFWYLMIYEWILSCLQLKMKWNNFNTTISNCTKRVAVAAATAAATAATYATIKNNRNVCLDYLLPATTWENHKFSQQII